MIQFLSSWLFTDLGIDLGTTNSLVYLKGKGIDLNEPSVVAIDTLTGRTIAIGTQARNMIGKAPMDIKVIKPLEDGVIADFSATGDMLKY